MEENTYLKSLQILTKALTASYNVDVVQKSLTIANQSFIKAIKDVELYHPIIQDSITRSLSLFSEQTKYIRDAVKINVDAILKIDWSFIREVNRCTKTMFANLINLSSVFSNTIFSQELVQSNVEEIETETVINDSVVIVERVANEHSLTKLEKRNWLLSFFRFLNKFFASGLVAIILFLVSPIYNDIYNETIKPTYYYQEFRQLQQENIELQLRIIKRSTPLYKGKKMKSQLTILNEYEIVVVLDDSYGDRIKVQVYNTDYVGWIYKKYSSQ